MEIIAGSKKKGSNMGCYKIVKGKSTAGMLTRLVVNHQVTGPVSMELVKDLGSPRISARELQGPILSLLTGACQGSEHTNAYLMAHYILAVFCGC